MGDCSAVLDLLKRLVAEQLGEARVEALFEHLHTRRFDAYLLADADNVPPAAEYKPKVFSTRSGVDYFRPDGWVQVWLTEIDSDPDFAALRDWPVAYHGTDSSKLGSILEAGLRKPGELPGVQVEHGQAGAGADGAIYATPSLWQASHPVYSTLLKVEDDKWVQFVLKLRVRPGSYRKQRMTLSEKHWDPAVKMDPNLYHNEALEWLISESSDVMVVGLMVRELGLAADPEIFGALATGVVAQPSEGAEFCWTRLLQGALLSSGYIIDSGTIHRCPSVIEWCIPSAREKAEDYSVGEGICSPAFHLPTASGKAEAHMVWFPHGKGHDNKHDSGPYMVIELVYMAAEPVWVEVQVGPVIHRLLNLGIVECGWAPYFRFAKRTPNDHMSVVVRSLAAEIPEMSPSINDHQARWNIDATALGMATWSQCDIAISANLLTCDGGSALIPAGSFLGTCEIFFAFYPACYSPWQESCELRMCILKPSQGIPTEEERGRVVRYRLAINDRKRVFSESLGELLDRRNSQALWTPRSRAMGQGWISLTCEFL